MRCTPLFVGVSVLAAALVCVVADVVVELGTLTIDDQLKRTSQVPMLLELMAHRCTHCQRFAPYYAEVARQLGDKAIVANVDGSIHRLQSLRFRIRYFPTFFLIYKGKIVEYNGPRSVDGLLAFVQSRGTVTAKPHDYFVGPLSPYWNAVGALLRAIHDAYTRILQSQLSPMALAAIAAAVVGSLVALFLVLIYVITKPPKPTLASESRPHAD